MRCPHCQKEFNAGKVMGSAKTAKKTAAAKKRGEWMKKAFANQKKMEGQVLDHGETKVVIGRPQSFVDPEFAAQLKKDNPALPGIAPKGSFTKDDLKAMIAGNRPDMSSYASDEKFSVAGAFDHTPHAPFDLNIEGEPHRVAQMGKGGLWLFYLAEDGNRPVRQLAPGELETLWEKRIK